MKYLKGIRLKRVRFYQNEGLYTVEGAFAITIFTALFMLLLSLISVIRVESVIQYAINETALELSQDSYVNNRELSLNGLSVCRSLTKENFHREDIDEWLERQGIINGYDGLAFSGSQILDDGENISIVVIYKLNLSAFANADKTLTICQKARTAAWLTTADKKAVETNEVGISVWKKDAFYRGKYFVRKIKAEYPEASVKSGQGVDLFFKQDRCIAEIYSMHVFMPSYSGVNEGVNAENYSPESYFADEEAIENQLLKYAEKFNDDIEKTERIIEMQDGTLGNFGRLNEKRLILIVPKEAEYVESFKRAFTNINEKLLRKSGIRLQVRYCEEAFV